MASPRTAREHVELFHLCFLRVLASGTDKSHYVVKGGCNLRFWFRSIRYSEDLDLDVTVTARATLKNKIDRLLAGPTLGAMLRAQGLAIRESSAPKQTETTQRWTILLAAEGLRTALPTKIEFSRRDRVAALEHAFEPIDPVLVRRYRMATPLAHHYRAAAAVAQKIAALAHRPETQARDLFDLHLLLTTAVGPHEVTLAAPARRDLPRAIERGMELSFDEYQGQVVAFLEADQAAIRASRAEWEQLQSEAILALEALL